MDELERNRATIRAHFAALDSDDGDAFAATHATDARNHAPAAFDMIPYPAEGKPFGPREARETFDWLRGNWRDLRIEVEHLLAEGDQVVAWVKFLANSPDGRPIEIHHAHRFRLAGGLIVEHWAVRDDLRAMLQAGIIQPPGPPPPPAEP